MDDEIRDAFRRAADRMLDEAFYGTNAVTTSTVGNPGRSLTLADLDRAYDAVTTDRRTLIVADLHRLERAMAPHGWRLVKHPTEPGYWLQREAPRWRIRMFSDTRLRGRHGRRRDTVYLIDPEAASAPRTIDLPDVLTTVTALALAGVDETVG